MNDQEICALITGLIKTCNECERGFRLRAENVRSARLAVILAGLGGNCEQRARELQNHLLQLGGHPPVGRSRWDAAHRVWFSLRGLLCANVDLAVLRDCKRREDLAVSRYRQAFDQALPESLQTLLKRQYLGAKCNNVRITDLLVLAQTIGPQAYRQPVSSGHPRRNGRGPSAAAH